MRIHYISYGIFKTGGYRHEKTLFDSLAAYIGKKEKVRARQFRKNKYFTSLAGYLELLLWSFFRSNADINIVTVRSAIPAMLRNRFNNNEVWIVLHNFDPDDGKSERMEKYYRRLFSILSRTKHDRFKVIAVAPYWQRFFTQNIGIRHTYYFPNLFDTEQYEYFRHTHKNAWIHLGQFSSKNDPGMPELAQKLTLDGYYCFFSTLHPDEARPNNGIFEICYFEDFTYYLDQMSRCCCTLALTSINEGWNRIAHESLLVGTPVIGYATAGLGDLLKASNSMTVKNTDEVYTCIKEALWVLPDAEFIKAYDINQAEHYLKDICKA